MSVLKTLLKSKDTTKNLSSNWSNVVANDDDPDWFKIACEELGVSEEFGANHNKRIIEYHQATFLKASDDETPWCSAFLCWCMEKAGMESPRSPVARAWLQWGSPLSIPQKGCIAVFKRGTKSWQGHAGFFVADNKDEIYVLSGNQDNRVSIAPYKRSDFLGYRMPKN